MTVCEVRGFGRQRGHKETDRGAKYTIDFMPKAKVEVVVEDSKYEETIKIICNSARTGQIGDGKVWVTDVGNLVRIRTGERGVDAV